MRRVQVKNRRRQWRLLIADRRQRARTHEDKPPPAPKMTAAQRLLVHKARRRVRELFLELTDEIITLIHEEGGR